MQAHVWRNGAEPAASCSNCPTTSCRGRATSHSDCGSARWHLPASAPARSSSSMMVVIWFLARSRSRPRAPPSPAIDYSLAAMIGKAHRAGVDAGRLQLADQRRADPRHGGARGGGRRARHDLCRSRAPTRVSREARPDPGRRNGRSPPPWPCSPGTSSRRNAPRRWPSSGARPTAGSGCSFCSATCWPWPTRRPSRPYQHRGSPGRRLSG